MAADIITVDFRNQVIRTSKIKTPQKRKVSSAALLPATEDVQRELAGEHTAEPIKDIDDINRVSQYLIENDRLRDNMLFIIGINFGLRVSDLLQLRFCDLINDDLSFKTSFPVLEKKTRNTRKVKKNRYITINEAVMDAVTLFLEEREQLNIPCRLDDFLFRSESMHGAGENKPLSRMSVDRILKNIANELDLGNKMSSHSLRKTFAYHQMVMSGNDPRKLLLLQKMFGHSTSAQTLDYIGITNDEIKDAYLNLNLGSDKHYMIDSQIVESGAVTA